MSKEYTYDIDKYTIGVDENVEDGIGMTVAKIENGEINFLGNCYGENARCIDLLIEENQELNDLIDTILNFSFFKEECPLNFGFEDNSKEDEAQNIFYSDEYCENNCNGIYKDCWLKYFKELQGGDKNE